MPWGLGALCNFQRLGLGPEPGVLGSWGAKGVLGSWTLGSWGARSGPRVGASCQAELGCVVLSGAPTKTEVG